MSCRIDIIYKECRTNGTRPGPSHVKSGYTASLDYQDAQSLLAARSTLRAHLDSLESLLLIASTDSTQALRVLRDIRSDASVLSSLDDNIDGIIPVSRRPSDRSALKAKEVFAIPGLLEQILLQLAPSELLRAYQVARAFYSTIEGSIKLQEVLCLRPASKSHYFSLFDGSDRPGKLAVPGLKVCHCTAADPAHFRTHSSVAQVIEPASIYVYSRFRSQSTLPRIGNRVRSMLMCQPPLQQITVRVRQLQVDRLGRRLPRNEKITMTIPTGLTVGDMVDAAEEVRAKYVQRQRGKASWYPDILFEGEINVSKDDPLLSQPQRGAIVS